jgi:hypothetical protein
MQRSHAAAAFKAERVVKKYTMNLSAEPAVVFPLLCPVREYEWIEPWSCDMVFSASGVAENNAVFMTDFPPRRVAGKPGSCADMKKIGRLNSFVWCPNSRSTGWMWP